MQYIWQKKFVVFKVKVFLSHSIGECARQNKALVFQKANADKAVKV